MIREVWTLVYDVEEDTGALYYSEIYDPDTDGNLEDFSLLRNPRISIGFKNDNPFFKRPHIRILPKKIIRAIKK